MSFRLRHLIIRFILPRIFASSERQRVRILQEFSRTELDSAWQRVYALQEVRDPETRSLLFDHAFEELFHADLFQKLAVQKSSVLPAQVLTRRQPLMDLEGSSSQQGVEFLAYLAIGETEINDDFAVYQSSMKDPDLKRILKTIRADELWHARDSTEALARLTERNGVVLKKIRSKHLWGLRYRRYVSLMMKFGTIPVTLLLGLAYGLFGFIAVQQARRRMNLDPEAQRELLKWQQARVERKVGTA